MNGAKKLLLVVSDGTKKLPNSYLKITDIRVNGKSINFTDVGFGAHYGDQYIQATDDYSIIYDDWMAENNSAESQGLERQCDRQCFRHQSR